tara:strand:- start:154 stop:1359 length:1206 start_codon:yes stop_codon:yes gene_type:complete
MTEFLLQLTLPLSVVILLVIAAQQLLLQRLGAATVYMLWAAVPLLLLTNLLLPLLPVAIETLPVQHYQVGLQQLSTAARGADWLLWFWLAGVGVCLSLLLLSYLNNLALLKRAKPVHLASITSHCLLAETDAGPFVTGFVSPCIVLPSDFFTRFNPLQQQLILQHEQTHWRRGDLHLNYLALLLVSMFWFNPLVWLGYRQYRQAQELACDALVTKHALKAEKIAYGYALLSSTRQTPGFWCPLTHYYGDFNIMKQRIMQLKNQQGLSKTVVSCAMALVVATTLFVQQPALAGSNKAQKLAPVVRIEPKYPLKAAEKGITGFVRMTFSVDADGVVDHVTVVKSSPEGMFEQEAVEALKKWRYTATGTEHKGQQVQLDFELDVVTSGIERISVTPPAPPKGVG